MAYQVLTPIHLKFSEIPVEGRTFVYSPEATPELSGALEEVFGNNPWKVEIFVQPAGDAYRITGLIRGERDLLCSRCAADVKFQVQEKIDEFFSIFSNGPIRIEQSSRVNHQSDLHGSGADWTCLEGETLNLGEYFREIVLANEPLKVLKTPPCDQSCPDLLKAIEAGWIEGSNEGTSSTQSPFAQLKDLKLN